VWGSPIIDDKENIYAGSSNGFFYAIDKNGNIIWKYKIEDSPDGLIDSAACFAGDDKVVIPGGDGFLHCVEKSTGRRLWVFKAYHSDDSEHHKGTHVNSFEGNAVFENGIIYAGSDNGYFYAVDIEGNEKWSFKTGMMIWSAPVFGLENKWMAFGSLDNHIYFVNPESGKLLAKKKLDGAVKSSPCFDPRSSLLFACTSNGAVYCFSIAGLAGNDVNEWTLKISLKWKKKFIGEIYSSPSFHENKLVFGTSRGRLYCLNFHGKKVAILNNGR